MISEARLKKLEENAKVIEQKNYKYIFHSQEEYEQGKLDGLVDPEGTPPALILD